MKKRNSNLCVEALEKREMLTTGITAWMDSPGGVLYVSGTPKSDSIQIRFANHQIQILDQLTNKAAQIKVTKNGQTTTSTAIDRDQVPYYIIVSTSEGSNRVDVVENAANPAKPLAIYGGQGDDILNGGSANDAIYGLGGVDTISGGKGDDYLVACYGLADEAAPARGERLDGGEGNDTLIGGKGNDTLIGGGGFDTFDGRGGTDTAVIAGIDAAFITDSRLAVTRYDGMWNMSSNPMTSIENIDLTARVSTVNVDAKGFTGSAVLHGPGGTAMQYSVAGKAQDYNFVYMGQAIWNKYQSLGGESGFLGRALTNEAMTSVGNGQCVHFKGGSIYSSAATGTHVLYGAIRDKWGAMGRERSLLGLPTSDEYGAANGVRISNFQNGIIVWSATTGAHEVHGAILGKYLALGGPNAIGTPLTDETVTPDGIGRFNHFQNGSIYWSPASGAHLIYGAIRDKWASMGWERSSLGYPTSDEEPYIATSPYGRSNSFQNGYIAWNPTEGVAVTTNLAGGYYLTVKQGNLRLRNQKGEETTVAIPKDKITQQQQDDFVKTVGDKVVTYFKDHGKEILDGKIKAADIGGYIYGIAAAGVLKLYAPLAAYEGLAQLLKSVAPVDLTFTNAATQTGRYYGAIVDDFVAILKGQNKTTITNVVGTMASLYITAILPQGAILRAFGTDGWSLTKKVGEEIGGALDSAISAVESAVGDVWNKVTHPGDWF